mgnify:CR=1 FL=1|jgi:hypothetical protein
MSQHVAFEVTLPAATERAFGKSAAALKRA